MSVKSSVSRRLLIAPNFNSITMYSFLSSQNMQAISECFDGYHKRWNLIESVCGYRLTSSLSSPTHTHPPHSFSESLISVNRGKLVSSDSVSSLSSVESSWSSVGSAACSYSTSSPSSQAWKRGSKIHYSLASVEQYLPSTQSLKSESVPSPSSQPSVDYSDYRPLSKQSKLLHHSSIQSQCLGYVANEFNSEETRPNKIKMKQRFEPKLFHHSESLPSFLCKESSRDSTESVGNGGGITFVAKESNEPKLTSSGIGSRLFPAIAEEKKSCSGSPLGAHRSVVSAGSIGQRTLVGSAITSDV